MSIISQALFNRYPWDDSSKVQKRIIEQEYGPHWFFRCVKSEVRERFHQLMNNSTIPTALLFGSPHMDNYAKTDTGCGMIDFDRSYVGPYAWDLVCLIVSVSLRQKQRQFTLVEQSVLDALLTGYTEGLLLGEQPYQVYQGLAAFPKKKWQQSIESYLVHNKKWAKKMNDFPVSNKDVLMNELMKQYLENLATSHNPKEYKLIQAGRTQGTFNRIHNILLLENQNNHSRMLVDIKQTRCYRNPNWGSDRYYTTGYDHDGIRMIAASCIHAPGVTANESYATVNGVQYWGRSVPLQNAKIKNNLTAAELENFCFAVGNQIGRSHGQTGTLSDIQNHLAGNFKQIASLCETILRDIENGWINYHDILKLGSKNENKNR